MPRLLVDTNILIALRGAEKTIEKLKKGKLKDGVELEKEIVALQRIKENPSFTLVVPNFIEHEFLHEEIERNREKYYELVKEGKIEPLVIENIFKSRSPAELEIELKQKYPEVTEVVRELEKERERPSFQDLLLVYLALELNLPLVTFDSHIHLIYPKARLPSEV